ncbi:MAG: AsmA-like C-terminal domain-containing protein [Rickettsiales bacterium]
MVKIITHCSRCLVILACAALLVVLGSAYWLHGTERSLNFAKPWMLAQLNSGDAPYAIDFATASIDWRDATNVGHIRIAQVTLSKREGAMFATLPRVEITFDPLGFLPGRHLLGGVWLDEPRIFMNRNLDGEIQLGLEGSPGSMKLGDLFRTTTGAEATKSDEPVESKPVAGVDSLPFHSFYIKNAALNFADEKSGTSLISNAFSMKLVRDTRGLEARLVFPFQYEDEAARLDARLYTIGERNALQLDIGLTRAPAKLLCVFGLCPDKVEGEGPVSGVVGVTLQPDGVPTGVQVNLTTNRAVLSAPELFEKPLKLGASSLNAYSTGVSHTITINAMKLALEDTTIDATGAAHHEPEAGWTLDLEAKTGPLDVTKIRYYWPLPMAPDSRLWVTSKMKSGRAESGTLKVHITPEDFAAPAIADVALSADVDARNISFEYLPGFPNVEGMDGLVHFTGRTIRIDGSGGHLLTGTKLEKAVLWMPDLLNPRNPMEATLKLAAPANDIATFLALKHFAFDDTAQLDPATIFGSGTADIVLKFDSFSEQKSVDPNAVNFDHVDYDIKAKLVDIAQEKFFGSYSVKKLNGELVAKNGETHIFGQALVGDSPLLALDFSQKEGAPIHLDVKNVEPTPDLPGNDFSMVYTSGTDGPQIDVKGRELDLTAAYSKSENSLLKDFPALHLDLALDSLWLTKDLPLTNISGRLDCTELRCEAANINAVAGRSKVRGVINRKLGRRQFTLTASHAGDLLKALDVSDRLLDGTLEFAGPYDDSKVPPALNAHLNIENFRLKNAQILGRILTVTSLTGVQNLLTGSGISFNKMVADIHQRAGIVTIKKGKANGASIGITAEGKIDTNTTGLKIKGVVVPAYALNSILSNIPLIGELVGGDGEGLIAFNYGVQGTLDNPQVGVNPLSGLTPGFLRGIFGVFDGKKLKEDEGIPVEEDDTPATTAAPQTTQAQPAATPATGKLGPLHTPPVGVQAPNNNGRR